VKSTSLGALEAGDGAHRAEDTDPISEARAAAAMYVGPAMKTTTLLASSGGLPVYRS